MTVGKLIEILQKAPKDMEVKCLYTTEDGNDYSEIESVGYHTLYSASGREEKYLLKKYLLIGECMTEENFPEDDLLWGRDHEESKKARLAELTQTFLPENERGGAK